MRAVAAVGRFLAGALVRALGRKPPVVRVETTNACNAHCGICPRHRMTRPVGVMEVRLYERIIDEARTLGARQVQLYNYGEPLLDPHLPERIAFARGRGLRTTVSTNGSLLTPELAGRLVEAGVDWVRVSVSGCTRETFERSRPPLQFDEVMRGVENLLAARDRRATPRVTLGIVDAADSRPEIRGLKRQWKHRVDRVEVGQYHNWASADRAVAPLRHALQRRLPCSRLWRTVTVLWDGRVCLCCLDYDGQTILGDLVREPLGEVWSGDAYQAVRQRHIAGQQDEIPLCRGCDIGRL